MLKRTIASERSFPVPRTRVWDRTARLVIVVVCGVVLGGCEVFGDSEERQPSIGTGIDHYKRSPCACLEVELEGKEGWLELFFGETG